VYYVNIKMGAVLAL